MKVRLDIGRLVLDGIDLDAHDRAQLQSAAETELARILTERGLSSTLAGGTTMPALHGSDMNIARDATPADIGVAIARSVAGGVSK